jgi:RNA polymerase sigma factor (TIGR02999 family)
MGVDPSGLLIRAVEGDRQAAIQLTPLVYEQLRALAGEYIEDVGQDRVLLQRTALVHEAYLKLMGGGARDLRTRTHFFAVAATAMRQVLIDHLREQNRVKRGGGWRRVTMGGTPAADGETDVDLEALDAALRTLEDMDARAAEIVQLRFFGGLSEPEVAQVLGISERTVRSDWAMARAWLRTRLDGACGESDAARP